VASEQKALGGERLQERVTVDIGVESPGLNCE
jgi:hypothetical protein